MGFTKWDDGTLNSSLYDEHSDVTKVFLTFCSKSDSEGYVRATYKAMFRASNLVDDNKNLLPVERFDWALNKLLNRDTTSRTKDHDGKRIIRIEESLWYIVNKKKYRDTTYSDNPEAVRKRKYRQKSGTCPNVSQSVLGHSVYVSVSDSSNSSPLGEENSIKLERLQIPPTLEMVDRYCEERKNGIDPSSFIDFYTSKNWMIGKNRMKDWQAAVRTWERNRKKENPHRTRVNESLERLQQMRREQGFIE